jgi:hypothetical protein
MKCLVLALESFNADDIGHARTHDAVAAFLALLAVRGLASWHFKQNRGHIAWTTARMPLFLPDVWPAGCRIFCHKTTKRKPSKIWFSLGSLWSFVATLILNPL